MKYSKYISLIYAFSNLLILNIYFIFSFCYFQHFDKLCFNNDAYTFYIFVNLSWIVLSYIFKLNKEERQANKKEILLNYTKTTVFFFFLFLLFFQIISFEYYSRDQIKILFSIFFISLVVWKFILYYSFLHYRKLGYNYLNVIIVGYNDTATQLKDYFQGNVWTGYRFKGFFTHQKSDKKEIAGTYDELEDFVRDNLIDEIYIMTDNIHKSAHKIISGIIGKHAVRIRLVPDLSDFSYMNIKMTNYATVPVIRVQRGPLNYWYNRWVKRLFDIVISLLIILFVFSWLIPVLFIFDLFSGREGVFFVQNRSGLNNNTFKLFKFRTMKSNTDANIKQATEDDKRITRLGKFLRKTSIDELPQFINVLGGKMSVIGPRPHMLKHTDEYKLLVNNFMIRHTVKPGITGYAQVKGQRGEIKKNRDMKKRVRLDISYVENWSLSLDIKIILLTVINLIKRDEKAY